MSSGFNSPTPKGFAKFAAAALVANILVFTIAAAVKWVIS